MPLDWATCIHHHSDRALWRRRSKTLRLLSRFHEVFPDIHYELHWGSQSVNAQAWRHGSDSNVSIYGGLVRHPIMTICGLALTVAHETGHHLGGLPRDPELRWPTWQGQADYWAAKEAMPRVFGTQAPRITAKGAREIVRLTAALGMEDADLSNETRYKIFVAGLLQKSPPICFGDAFTKLVRRPRE